MNNKGQEDLFLSRFTGTKVKMKVKEPGANLQNPLVHIIAECKDAAVQSINSKRQYQYLNGKHVAESTDSNNKLCK